uniref:Uncharacterized protein n=1 Tax=Setaria digitata TaxID=48799 RepID=A0A915PEG6_9BILA
MVEQAKPVAMGVVVSVDLRLKYGIIHASGYGRVLVSHNFDSELVQLSNWLSVEVEPNVGPILTFERTRCSFVDAGEPKIIDELLPTGTSVSKTGAVNLRIQTPVFLGNTSFGSSVGLSPHLGRVYLNQTLCKKFKLNPLTWIHCGVVAVAPCKANFNSFWEARTAGREDSSDPKLSQCIRRCLGRFHAFMEKNICVLQLFNKYNNDEGFACVHSFDFSHTVHEQDLKKAHAIQVYVSPQLLYFPELPVPACYARIVDDGSRNVDVGIAKDKLAELDISTTSDNTVESDKSITTRGVMEKNAFRDLQTKVADTNRRLQLGDTLKKQMEQKRRIAELTRAQLLELDRNTPVYMTIGRIFSKGTVESEIARHEEEIAKAEEKITAIDHQRKYLEKNLAESEKSIRELVQSRP